MVLKWFIITEDCRRIVRTIDRLSNFRRSMFVCVRSVTSFSSFYGGLKSSLFVSGLLLPFNRNFTTSPFFLEVRFIRSAYSYLSSIRIFVLSTLLNNDSRDVLLLKISGSQTLLSITYSSPFLPSSVLCHFLI